MLFSAFSDESLRCVGFSAESGPDYMEWNQSCLGLKVALLSPFPYFCLVDSFLLN